MKLAGKNALVTGGGSGIGRGIAECFAREGARVVIVGRTSEKLEAVRREAGDAGQRILPRAADATNRSSVVAAVAWANEQLGSIDILVNNAGTNVPQPFVEVDAAALDRMLNLNVRAAFVVAQSCAQRMLRDADRTARGGAVINISSQLGRVALRGRCVYAMTKHAIEGLTRGMAIELAASNIRVNAVGPTWVDTPMTAPALADPGFRAEIIGQIPMGHLAQVRDITGAVVFLASPAAAMINGASLVVDGGWTAR
jgi:NAD(P)-dependent dehydrogenase (short-subunit alcohol dehydrogenase family)